MTPASCTGDYGRLQGVKESAICGNYMGLTRVIRGHIRLLRDTVLGSRAPAALWPQQPGPVAAVVVAVGGSDEAVAKGRAQVATAGGSRGRSSPAPALNRTRVARLSEAIVHR